MAHRNSYDDARYRPDPSHIDGHLHQSRPRAFTGGAQASLHQPEPRPQHSQDSLNPQIDRPTTATAATQVSPELVAQITQQVLNSLSLNGIATAAPIVTPLPLPTLAAQAAPIDIPQRGPPRDVFTSPSPEQYSLPNVGSVPPSLDEYRLDGQAERRAHNVHFMDHLAPTPLTTSNNNTSTQRPKPVVRASTGDATTLEKIWQPLFDTDGQPTARLGQFLRGLATHMIEDFEPQHSLVISPAKMLKFYDSVRLPNEVYPWHSLFGGHITMSSLSHLYRDLKCEHHFTQSDLEKKPSIPCLTPRGFETWMTLVIRSRPELEYKRFSDAVLHMPINNADNLKERFPKEISRRLFPAEADVQIQLDLEDAIYADPDIELPPNKPSGVKPKQNTQPISGSQNNPFQPPLSPMKAYIPMSASGDGPRKAPSTDLSDLGLDESMPPVPIERERKPYHTQAGGGKLHNNEDDRSEKPTGRSNSISHHHRVEPREHRDSVGESATTKYARSAMSVAAAPVSMPHSRRQCSPSTSAQGHSHAKPEDHSAYSNASGATASTDDEDDRRGYKIKYSHEGNDSRGSAADTARGGYGDNRYASGRRGSVQPGSTSQRY